MTSDAPPGESLGRARSAGLVPFSDFNFSKGDPARVLQCVAKCVNCQELLRAGETRPDPGPAGRKSAPAAPGNPPAAPPPRPYRAPSPGSPAGSAGAPAAAAARRAAMFSRMRSFTYSYEKSRP